MSLQQIAWQKVYAFYLSNEKISYSDCASKFNISIDSVKKKGAEENWTNKKLQVLQSARQIIESKSAELLAKRNEEHIRQARLLQGTALEAIATKGLRPESFDVARKALEVGQKLERVALNMDRKEVSTVAVQNNFNSFHTQRPERIPFEIQWGDGEALGTFAYVNGSIENIETNDTP